MKGKKTAIVALLITIVGAIQGFDWATLIDNPQTVGWVVSGLGIVMFALRTVTTTPLFSSEPDSE